ncbi:MAG: regulator of protease activity HflC (stomatin/prohibitin superfamily), partial [Reinekea sp.]
MTLFTILALAAFFILKLFLIVVPMRESFVIERLGKFRTVFQPGLHLIVPFFDRVAYRHEIREQVYDIPSQHCITKDNIQVEIDGLVYLKVMDPQLASYGIGDYSLAAINMAQTTMRSEVGKLSLGEIFSERETLNETIVREIDRASESWGIKVYRYEVANISPSAHVVTTLEKQMVAERDRRADITLATAEKEAKINMSEGVRQEAINLSIGERQRRINIAEGRGREISLLAGAQATGIALVAEAINKPGGNTAIKMR